MDGVNDVAALNDEIFCLKFELSALSSVLMRSEAERWVPGMIFPQIEEEHKARYVLASTFTKGKDVLDAACGCGYGSLMLANEGKARSVMAVDIDADSIRYGTVRYPHPNIQRTVSDVKTIGILSAFDVAVSFETIEHINEPEVFLSKVHRALRPNGYFLVSTPIAERTTNTPHNKYHVTEWSYKDFHTLLAKHFSIEEIYVQSLETTPNRTKSLVKRFLNSPGKLPDSNLKRLTGALPRNTWRGYQLVVCKRV